MPWPKSSVPKFGGWDKSEDLSYSVIFDKARAEKEKFLHVSDKDLSPDQSSYKNSHEDAGRKTLFPDKARVERERFLPTSKQDEMFTRTHQNLVKNPEAIAGRGASHAPSYSSSVSHGGPSRLPLQNQATKGPTFLNERQYVDQAGFPEILQDKSTISPRRSRRAQNPPIGKTRNSQEILEASRIAEMQRKHAVPKFGDWSSGDAFTVEFNKARNEKHLMKSSKNEPHPRVGTGSPMQPDEDLYKSSELYGGSAQRQKQWGFFQIFCCSGRDPR